MIRISPSSLTALCHYETYLRKVVGLHSLPHPSALRGQAVAASYEAQLRTYAADRARGDEIAPWSPESVRAVTEDALARAWAEGVNLDGADGGELRASSIRDACAAAEVVRAKLLPRVVPQSEDTIEEWLEVYAGADLTLVGRYDVLDAEACVRDLKTHDQAPTTGDVSGNIQLAFYSYALYLQGRPVRSMALDWVRLASPRKPASVTVLACAPPETFGPLEERIDLLADVFAAGRFEPIDPTGPVGKWKCTSRFCSFFDSCPHGRARKVSVSMEVIP